MQGKIAHNEIERAAGKGQRLGIRNKTRRRCFSRKGESRIGRNQPFDSKAAGQMPAEEPIAAAEIEGAGEASVDIGQPVGELLGAFDKEEFGAAPRRRADAMLTDGPRVE